MENPDSISTLMSFIRKDLEFMQGMVVMLPEHPRGIGIHKLDGIRSNLNNLLSEIRKVENGHNQS